MGSTVRLLGFIYGALALVISSACAAPERDVVGQWQGVLPVQGGLRMVIKVSRAASGQLIATFTSVDQSPQETALKDVTLEGSTFRFGFDLADDRYEGTLSDEGHTITGKWFGSVHPGTFYPFDLRLATDATKWEADPSPHTTQFVTVGDDVKLEVLDWGGTVRPLVLLAGLGNDAHVFSKIAPKLAKACHVYGITRRGFGASSDPEPTAANYAADRLGDDVLAVVDALKLERPVLAGHSIAGEELSSIGSRHPEAVAGLIYLDAAYGYAFYDRERGNIDIDGYATVQKLQSLLTGASTQEGRRLTRELLETDLPQLTRSLEQFQKKLAAMPDVGPSATASSDSRKAKIMRAVMAGGQKYAKIPCPVLSIYAVATPAVNGEQKALDDVQNAEQDQQVKAFQAGVPSAKVVCLPNSNHYVFLTNEAEVLRLVGEFLATLPPAVNK